MADTARARKLSERIQQVVAQMLDTRIKDPRLGFVTVTDVRVTGDLQHADVFYTVLGDEAARTDTAAALESAKGIIRSEVGKQTGIRLTPTLAFHLDALPDTSAQLDEALLEAARRDREVAALAAQASFAGDADPYKKPGRGRLDRGADARRRRPRGPGSPGASASAQATVRARCRGASRRSDRRVPRPRRPTAATRAAGCSPAT